MWTVDGANNNDVGSNRTILVYPSVDAIEEFKIQRNNYGAEFGQAGGAHVNLVTRGGTNEFHGSAYYYARRDKFNAIDYFLEQAGQEAAPLKWDDFGGTFGGPILKDKLHFFSPRSGTRTSGATSASPASPPQAERNGDFSSPHPRLHAATPIDPLTGQPFPGNIIPANRISPGGQLMMQPMSLPNTTPSGGCNNWVEAVATPIRLAPGERARRLDGERQHAADAALHAGLLEVGPEPVGRRPVPGGELGLEPAGQDLRGPAQQEHRLAAW